MRLARTPDGLIHIVGGRTSVMACGVRRFDVTIVYAPEAPTCLWCACPVLASCGHVEAEIGLCPARLYRIPDSPFRFRCNCCSACAHTCEGRS